MTRADPVFSADIVDAVLAHMNSDHNDDNLLIARAFGSDDATACTMVTLDEHGGTWIYSGGDVRTNLTIPWSTELAQRGEIRREIVRLYDESRTKLGIEPRAH